MFGWNITSGFYLPGQFQVAYSLKRKDNGGGTFCYWGRKLDAFVPICVCVLVVFTGVDENLSCGLSRIV